MAGENVSFAVKIKFMKKKNFFSEKSAFICEFLKNLKNALIFLNKKRPKSTFSNAEKHHLKKNENIWRKKESMRKNKALGNSAFFGRFTI